MGRVVKWNVKTWNTKVITLNLSSVKSCSKYWKKIEKSKHIFQEKIFSQHYLKLNWSVKKSKCFHNLHILWSSWILKSPLNLHICLQASLSLTHIHAHTHTHAHTHAHTHTHITFSYTITNIPTVFYIFVQIYTQTVPQQKVYFLLQESVYKKWLTIFRKF